jgi:hypothetical protein
MLAPQGVEVEHQPRGVAVRDAGGGQISAEHLGPLLREREHRFSGGLVGQEHAEVGGQVGGEIERRRVAVLAVAGGDGRGRAVAVEVEGFRPHAAQFAVACPGRDRQPVAERPGRPGHLLIGRAVVGGGDELSQLVDADRSPIMPPIFLGVVADDGPQDIIPHAAVLPGPCRESPDRRPVMIAGRQGPARIAEGREGCLDSIGGQVGQPGGLEDLGQLSIGCAAIGSLGRLGWVDRCELAPGHQGGHAAGSVGGEVGVLGRAALVEQVAVPGVEMFGQRPGGVVPVGFGPGIDQPVAPQRGGRLQLAGLPPGGVLVGVALNRPASAVRVHVCDVPVGALAPPIPLPLEHTRHAPTSWREW